MIPRDTHYDRAAHTAERIIREHNITSLPVDPIAIANSLGIEVVAKPASDGGVSGMLIRYGEQFCIAYATHIKSPGFRRFTIAHELGHYFLEGHVDAIFKEGFRGHSVRTKRNALTYSAPPTVRPPAQEPFWTGQPTVGREGLRLVSRGLSPAGRPHQCSRHKCRVRAN
jgi:IrrE N-terminal-like domain